jgi:glycosidase
VLNRPSIVLSTEGGEAWTFEKEIEGVIASGRCDEVVVRTQGTSVAADVWAGGFRAITPLRTGANETSAECRRNGRVTARSPAQLWSVRLVDGPKAWVRLRAAQGLIYLDAGRSEAAQAFPAPLTRFQWFEDAANPTPLVQAHGRSLHEEFGRRIELIAPTVDGEYRVRLRATDESGRFDESIATFRVRHGQAQEVNVELEHPIWAQSSIVYGVAPFFYRPQSFAGVSERLDEIAALGATAVWISPITTAAPDDFGYAVTDHFRLRAAFGAEQDFRRLVERAHGLGLRVIIDFVPNHFATEHRYYQDARRKGERSAYYRWFDRDDRGEVTHYFDWNHLQNLEYDNPEVQNEIIAAFAYWAREFRVNGFRVDASWAVRERAPEFWPRLRSELKRIDPDLLLLAEASVRDPYYSVNGFDAAYDWTDKVGEWAWRGVFDGRRVDLVRLRAALADESARALTLRFLNNNDTGTRFIARYGLAATKLAAALLFTLPGIPLIYNGDEVGAEFEPYEEGPPIDWRDRHGLAPYYKRLARLRRSVPALHGPRLELLSCGADEVVLAYKRPKVEGGDDAIVLLNFDVNARSVELPYVRPGEKFEDLLTGELVKLDSHRRVSVKAQQAMILSPHEESTASQR